MEPAILLIDNYDSFVHNLARYFRRLGVRTLVQRNDALDASQARRLSPRALVLSPGPCAPRQAGNSIEIVRSLYCEVPMLGVCLGHQTIAAALGGRIIRAPQPMHGRTSEVEHDGQGLFREIPSPLTVCRYHSLVVDAGTLPDDLEVTCWTTDAVVMALRHRRLPLYGVQFHPESILTQAGFHLLGNFLRLAGITPGASPELSGELREPQAAAGARSNLPVTF